MPKIWIRTLRAVAAASIAASAFGLVQAETAGASARAKPSLPPEVYFGQGEQVFRFETAAGHASSRDEPQRSGCSVNAFYRATGAGSASKGFEFWRDAEASGLDHLGSDYAQVRASVEHPEQLLDWTSVFTQEVCLTDGVVVVTQRSGPDTVSWSIDRDFASARVTVNGQAIPVSIEALRNGTLDPHTAGWLSDRFVDEAGFGRAWHGYQWQLERSKELYEWRHADGPTADGCARPCFFCGLKTGGTLIGGVAGIITTCNPAVVIGTAGTACMGVGGAIVLGLADGIASCIDCDRCLNPPAECDDERNCKEGYECCCDGEMCCREGYEPSVSECEA